MTKDQIQAAIKALNEVYEAAHEELEEQDRQTLAQALEILDELRESKKTLLSTEVQELDAQELEKSLGF